MVFIYFLFLFFFIYIYSIIISADNGEIDSPCKAYEEPDLNSKSKDLNWNKPLYDVHTKNIQ